MCLAGQTLTRWVQLVNNPNTMKRPSFQLYPKDVLSDRKVAVMNNEQLGGYFKLLCYMWQEEDCSLPNDTEELAALSGLDEAELDRVMRCFIPHPSLGDRISQKRLLAEREKQDTFRKKMSEAGKKGNKKRWSKPKKKVSPSDNQAIASDRSSSPSSNIKKDTLKGVQKTPGEMARSFFGSEVEQTAMVDHLVKNGMNREVAAFEVREFCDYWTESTKSGKKVKWELRETFDIKKRLATWMRRSHRIKTSGPKKKQGTANL